MPGAVDYLVEDLRALGPQAQVRVEQRWRDGVLVDFTGSLARLAAIRFFSSCSVWLEPDLMAALARSREAGCSAPWRPSQEP